MPTLDTVVARNARFAPKLRPVLVVFGGTSGIGEGTLRAFAQHTKGNIHIIVLGRSKSSAETIFASLPQHMDSLYEFVFVDALLMRNIVSIIEELKSNSQGTLTAPLTKINYLVLSQGAALVGKPDTEEGLQPLQAIAVYGRLRCALELAPLVEEASRLGEDARILNVVYAGIGGVINLEDLGERHVPFYRLRGAISTYTDIYTLEFAQRHPTVAFTHIYPGMVRTKLSSGMAWPFNWIIGTLEYFFGTSKEDCGQFMMYAILDDTATSGAHFKNNHAEAVSQSKWSQDPVARGAVWKHLVEKSRPRPLECVAFV
ncbi:NAD(P)-binding protein [Auriculariales sp. MPI-PUGE-AT-0066]|nr:NAD(P)-binding protein [Auriculariales sp. MPI-PUGE-AT-0066]